MNALDDIILKSNTLYNRYTKVFEDIHSNVEFEIVEEPVIVMDTLHGCFSHAILDSCFPIFWIIDDLLKAGNIPDKNVRIFVRERAIRMFPSNLEHIDNGQYKGVFNDIIKIITPFPVYFEHILHKHYMFKTCIIYPYEDRWQRTPWNCKEYYPQRNVPMKNVRFSDTVIYEKLSLFRNTVLTNIQVENENTSTNRLMIIDRKYNRKIDPSMLKYLVWQSKQHTGVDFTGVVCLEDKPFEEQVKLFATHRMFIFRHGSCLINLLWIPNNSIVFELQGGPQGVTSPYVIPRICKLTNSKHILLNYTLNDCQTIFKLLN